MSRRLRFQVKPNLNLNPTAASEEGKSANIASTPVESKIAALPAENINATAAEEPVRIRSPTPAPQPILVFSSTDDAVRESTSTVSATIPTVAEETEPNHFIFDSGTNQVTTSENVPVEVPAGSSIENQVPMPPPAPPQVHGKVRD